MEDVLFAPAPYSAARTESAIVARSLPDLPDGSFGSHIAQHILDHVHFGVLLVGPQLQVWLANEAARRGCARHSMLSLDDDRLTLAQRHHQVELLRAVAKAQDGRWGMVQLVHGADRLLLAVVPLWRDASGGPDDPVLVMFGMDTPCASLAIEFYGRACSLTPAEVRLLRGLKEGLSPRELARRYDVALSTVRSQISSIRAKTGARSIVDLVRTLSCLPPIMAVGGIA
ncbi:MAG TPA: helix-turn-helix transcriptional regulator [Burkholderiaceae bacterium]|nr:helix-turn-helix transcriptional regulator [Burkholderiaceae bacterium]